MNPVDVFAFLPHLGGGEELETFFLNLAMTFVGEKKTNNYSKKTLPRGLPHPTMWLTIVLI